MVLELASVRALAPFFGASTEIWTSAIGVVLFALACGYAAGGALAERGRAVRALGIALALAGALSCAAPIALPRIAKLLLPANLALGDAISVLRGGALITQCAIFAAPVFLLGFANPLFVKALPGSSIGPGRAAGLVLAFSTLGGLAGTFGTTYYFIPQFGVRATLFGCGLALGGLGTMLLACDHAWRPAVTVIVIVGVSGYAGKQTLQGPVKDCNDPATLLAEVEGREQYLRAIEVNDPSGAAGRERWLQVSECLDSFQSLDAPARKTPGHYYDVLAAASLFSGVDRGARICIIGAGTGSVARSLAEMTHEPAVDAVEVDSAVVDLGRRFFRLSELESFTKIHSGIDGRLALQYLPANPVANASVPAETRPESAPSPSAFDAILIDAYARQVEIPYHLVTREMFALCKQKLADGGIVAINVSSFGNDDPVLRAIAGTLSSIFAPGQQKPPNVAILNVRRDHNAIVIARRGSALPTPARFLQKVRQFGLDPTTAVAQCIAGPGGMFLYEPAASDALLTDDCAPMEQLQARSLQLATRGN
ncbi:MAG: fused MFS/spermidine synthase [Planctomycetes bacterium]|nr:fused MFS/spermidine synthase [Planctomycetota bacterium]